MQMHPNTINSSFNIISKDFARAFGVALIMEGLPLAWILRYYFPLTFNLSNIFFIAGILFMIDFRKLYRVFAAYDKSSLSFIPLLFTIPAFIAALFSDYISDVVYFVFTFAFLLGLRSLYVRQLILLPQAFVIVGFLTCISTVVFLFISGYSFTVSRLVLGETYSPGFLAHVASLIIISSLFLLFFYPYNSIKLLTFLAKINLSLGSVILVLTLSRSPYIGIFSALCFLLARFLIFRLFRISVDERTKDILYSQYKKQKSGKYKYKRIGFLLNILITLAFLLFIIFFEDLYNNLSSLLISKAFEYLDRLWIIIINGSETYLRGGSQDMSSQMRVNLIDYAMRNLSDLGHGYRALWIDNPVLQSFYDGGILGFSVFVLITLVIPICLISRSLFYKSKHPVYIFSSCLYVYYIPYLFLHGHPYSYAIWTNVIFFYSIFSMRNTWLTDKT